MSPPPNPRRDQRSSAFARLFDAVHEGIFVGTLPAGEEAIGTTLAANPALRRLLDLDVLDAVAYE